MKKRIGLAFVIGLFFVMGGLWLTIDPFQRSLCLGDLAHLFFSSRDSLSYSPIPKTKEWMLRQIKEEFAYFHAQGDVSRKRIDQLTSSKEYAHLQLVKFTIKNNKVEVKKNFSSYSRRVSYLRKAIEEVCRSKPLPDMNFVVSMHDEVDAQLDIPLFVMAKNQYSTRQVLIPDFEALHGKYQVLKRSDITKEIVPWKEKKNQLIWRGSTAQHPLRGSFEMNDDNIYSFSRVRLCELSQRFPQAIDAKFTMYIREAKNIIALKKFQGRFVSFEEQLNYKYHLMIDGNTCAYSASGWKLFSNSLIFKTDSNSIQWYYNMLKPYVHYIPVRADLEDLVDKIHWATVHDEEAQAIARRARDFALIHIVREQNMAYLYETLLDYSTLNFVD